MNDAFLKTLFHPFEAGLIEPPGKDARVLFLNAAPGFRPPEGLEGRLTAVQDFRPAFLALEAEGHHVVPEAEGEGYDLALVLAGRHRGRNGLWVADALKRVRPGGRVVVAGGKTDGAASLRKRIGGLLDLEGHASKNHGVVFWFVRPEAAEDAASALEAANPPLLVDEGFATVPGLFSHDRVDAGSRLLAQALPGGFKGVAADFGAGWGFLSVKLAQGSPQLSSIDLFEASYAACTAARRNMAALAPDMEARVIWRDLNAERTERRYDLIVMNPPFHQARAAEPAIGAGMVRAASAALRPGGRLWLVANRGLPYEAALQAGFARHGEAVRDERFKVLWAVR